MIRVAFCSLALLFVFAARAEPASPNADATTGTSPVAARPRIGLVLSGGGARGLAHIGVLKVLEREHIPVDVISGTSMGAIIGGLYASGLSATELEKQLLAISWNEVFASRVDRQQLSERRKEEDFQFSPVLEFGLRDGELRAPQGTLSSRGLEVLLRRLTLPVRSITSFDQLPTPFRAVATDMESGGEIVIGEGDLALAMRSSMSVPGVFAPVESKGRVLGDGGLVDNLPVDVARDMGAEQVIAVNVGTPPGGRESLQSLVGLTGQMITLLMDQNVQRSLASLWQQDLLITPNLGKLTAADFIRAPDFIAQGEAAAEALLPRLRPLALSPAAYAQWQAARAHRSPATPATPTLAAVKFEGAEISHPERFESRLESKPGQTFDAPRAERDARELASSGDYARVDYSVEPQPDGSDALVFALDEKPWGPNYFSAGLDLSTDFSGQSAFNLRLSHNRHWLTPDGAEWRNQLSIGQTPRVYSELYNPLGASGNYFVSGWSEIERRQFTLYDEDTGEQQALLSRLTGRVGLDIGEPFTRFGEIRLGLVHERWRLTPKLLGDESLPPDEVNGTWNETGVHLRAVVDQLDYAAFPQHGYRLQFESTVGRVSGGGISGTQPLSRVELQATDVASVGPSTLNLNLRLLQANQPPNSTAGQYTLGGFQQLSGYQSGQLSGRALAFGRATYYLRLGDQPVLSRGLFVGGSLEAGNTWDSRQDVRLNDLRYATSAFIGADTGIGPLYLAVGYAPRGGTVFYIFIGRP